MGRGSVHSDGCRNRQRPECREGSPRGLDGGWSGAEPRGSTHIPNQMHACACGGANLPGTKIVCLVKVKRSPENASACARVRVSDRGRGPNPEKRKRAGDQVSTRCLGVETMSAPSREGTARGRGYLPTTARPRTTPRRPIPNALGDTASWALRFASYSAHTQIQRTYSCIRASQPPAQSERWLQ